MRIAFVILAGLLLTSCGKKNAVKSAGPIGPTNPAPSPIIIPAALSNAPPRPAARYQYEEDLLIGLPPLIREDKAQQVVNYFKDVYPEMGTPRIMIYVIPDTVDAEAVANRREVLDKLDPRPAKKDPNEQLAANAHDNEIVPTTSDGAIIYEVRHLFTRPLRAAGALIVSDKTIKALTKDKPIGEVIALTDTPEMQVKREVLAGGADVLVEIYIFNRTVIVPSISGEQNISIPEIAVTAINLHDAKVVGTASSADVSKNISLARFGTMDVRQLAEVTALALMNDMVVRKR